MRPESFVLASVFVLAAGGKLHSAHLFRTFLRESVGLRDPLVRTVHALALSFEFAIVVSILLSPQAGGFAALAYVCAASAAICIALLRGRPGDCGCFGDVRLRGELERSGYDAINLLKPAWYAVRNSLFAGVSVSLILSYKPSPISYSYVLGLIPAMMMIVTLITSVWIEQAKIRRPTHPRRGHYDSRLAPLVVLDHYRTSSLAPAVSE